MAWQKKYLPVRAHSPELGQFTLLLKKDGSILQSIPKEDADLTETQPREENVEPKNKCKQ